MANGHVARRAPSVAQESRRSAPRVPWRRASPGTGVWVATTSGPGGSDGTLRKSSIEEGEEGDARVQAREAAHRKRRARRPREEPQAGDRDRPEPGAPPRREGPEEAQLAQPALNTACGGVSPLLGVK